MHSAKITIVNRLPEIRRVADFVDEFCARHAVPSSFVHETQVVLDEVLSNVIHHAFSDTAEHEIRVTLDLSGSELLAAVEDDGIAFDPTQARVVKLTAERAQSGGGLGLAFIRALCDRISYRREPAGNCLCVAKRIQGAGPAAARISPFNLSEVRHGMASVLSVVGRLDTANAQTMKLRFEEVIAAGAHRLAVDLSRVTYISSAGFWVLLFAENTAKRAGGGLVLYGLRDSLAQLVERAGLAQVLRVTATQEDALRALEGSKPE